MIICYEYCTARHVYNINYGRDEIFNNIIESEVESNTDYVSTVHIGLSTHNQVYVM